MATLELFGTASPNTQEMREWLEFRQRPFPRVRRGRTRRHRERFRQIAGGQRTVPVLVEDGKVVQ